MSKFLFIAGLIVVMALPFIFSNLPTPPMKTEMLQVWIYIIHE